MWRPLSKGLEILGRIRLRPPFRWRATLRVGDPAAPDAQGGSGWREYLDAERLYDVWGPRPDSAWTAFHCVPLFAALDSLKHAEVGPSRPVERQEPPPVVDPATTTAPLPMPGATIAATPPAPAARRELPAEARPGAGAPEWLTRDTWTILDLPGPMAVEAAAWLVSAGACQPVCTFDNWPHAKGVLKAEATLAELLRWATTVAQARASLDAGTPPVWVCDSERLGARSPTPREFDNRYYLDDSILPGPDLLKRAGIRRVVYMTIGAQDAAQPDLDGYFKDLLAAGLPVFQAGVMSPAGEPTPISLPPAPLRRPSGFRRSGAGGFGQHVPDPSSGGSGG